MFMFLLSVHVLLSDYEKTQFPCNSSVCFEACWLEGSLYFMFYVFVIVCCSCVVCFQSKQ